MPRAWEACATDPAPVGPAPSTRVSRPPSRRWSSGARGSSATAASPGAPATCAPWSRRGSGCATARAGCSGCSRASTSRGRRPGRSTPRPTRRRRSGSKKPARRDRGARAPAPRGAGRALVHGRGQDRAEGPPHARLVPEGGAPPRGMRQQGFASAHLFGAVCPERGDGVAPVLPEVSTAAMGVFLAELSRAVPAGTHAGLVLDGAGWHVSDDLTVPANLTLIPRPPYSPELNRAERGGGYLRDRGLSHRGLAGGYEAVVDAACAAWNALLAEPGRLRSLTNFPWLPASVTVKALICWKSWAGMAGLSG